MTHPEQITSIQRALETLVAEGLDLELPQLLQQLRALEQLDASIENVRA